MAKPTRSPDLDRAAAFCPAAAKGNPRTGLFRAKGFLRCGYIALVAIGGTCSGDEVNGPDPDPQPQPRPVVQLSSVPGLTNQSQITISGTTSANVTVQVSGGASTASGNANAQGAFAISVTLNTNQTNNLSVVARTSSGVQSDAVTATVVHDNIAPDIANLDIPTHTNQNPVTMTGSTEAGARVIAESPAETVETTADGLGAFSLAVQLTSNSANEITCVVEDPAGNQGVEAVAVIVHDNIAPTLTIQSPSGATFDTDGDARVNIEFSYDDGGASGVDLTSISVTNDRDIGGGLALGGIDAGVNLLPQDAVGPVSAMYNASLAHEFAMGTNNLTVTVVDSAGNDRTETVEFTVSGTEPSFTITQPGDGGSPPADGFAIVGEFSDVAGIIDEGSLTVIADNSLLGLLLQDGSQSEDVPAGENLGHLFSITSNTAEFLLGSSYAFPAGGMTLTGHVADRVGNISPADAVTFTFPTIPHRLFVVNSTVAPGAAAHVISIGLTSFTSFGGIQFTLQFDASVLTVNSVSSTGRAAFSPFYELSINGDSGELKVVLVDLAGDHIPEGSGLVVDIYASVSAEAVVQDAALTITGAEISDINGNPVDFVVLDGVLRIR